MYQFSYSEEKHFRNKNIDVKWPSNPSNKVCIKGNQSQPHKKNHLWISGSPCGRAHWDPRYTATSRCIFHRRFPDSLEAPGQPRQGLQVILWGHLRFTLKKKTAKFSDIMCSYPVHIPFILHQHSYSIISYGIQFIMDTASCPSLPHRWCQPRRTKQQLDQLNHTSHHQP